MTRHILAIDQGTTSTRAILFDDQAQIIALSQKELMLHYPENGWVEQNPEDIWEDTKYVCQDVLDSSGINVQDISAIGITNQRETLVLWDRETGKPVCNAIVWQDRRTADYCNHLKQEGYEDMIRQKTGLLLDPYFSGTKLRWILENIPDVKQAAEQGKLAFGTIDCYLLWRLTGGEVHATDATNASRTLLYNIVTQEWDEELLDLMGIPESLLPEVRDNSCEFGITYKDFLGAPIPVTGMAGDQHAALFGQACFEPGMIKSTYGTGCFALMNIGQKFKQSKHQLLTTIGYRLNGKTHYAIEGSIFIAGAAVQWLRDGLGLIEHARETENLVMTIPDNGGVYMVPAFTGLGAPHWDPEARGIITGLTRDSHTAHFIRAALEAQGYQTNDLMEAMIEDTGQVPSELRVDGGMVENNWVCQFLADITNLPVVRPEVIETTALGAAYLAGLYTGVYPSLEYISESWRCAHKFEPKMDYNDRDELISGWKHAVKRTTLVA